MRIGLKNINSTYSLSERNSVVSRGDPVLQLFESVSAFRLGINQGSFPLPGSSFGSSLKSALPKEDSGRGTDP